MADKEDNRLENFAHTAVLYVWGRLIVRNGHEGELLDALNDVVVCAW